LLGFQWAAYAALTYCGLYGFWVWHISRRVHTALPSTPYGRIFGYLPEAEYLAACNFTFQLWDFFISFTIAEHRTALMLTHHLLAASVSMCGLGFQYLHYFAVFYLGLSEFSSIFLVFVDLAKFFPPVPGTFYDKVVGVCGPCFVLTFFIYRVVIWWKVELLLFQDCQHVLKERMPQRLRPGKVWVIYFFCGSALFLGLLQIYWFYLVVLKVIDTLQS